METRLLIAYALIALLVLVTGVIGFRAWYNARPRATARQRLRENRQHDARLESQSTHDSSR